MKKEEFAQLCLGLKSAYPNFKIIEGKQAMDFWYMALSDISYKELSKAVYRHITTNKYPPSIADLRVLVAEEMATIGEWSEAWDLVVKKIQRYGRNRKLEALEEIKELDPIAYKVSKNQYINICNSENLVAERANFRDSYKKEAEKQKQILQIPANLRNEREKLLLNSYQVKELEGNVNGI